MTDRFYGGDDFEVCDYAVICMTGDFAPNGLLYGYESDGRIPDTYDATNDIIIGSIDAPDHMPAGAWQFLDNCMMLGAFAQIVSRP